MKTALGFHCEMCGLNFKQKDLPKTGLCPRCGSREIEETILFLDINGETQNDD